MCLAVIAVDAHPGYSVVIAANRDEFHARLAAPAAWWPQGWLAGRDLVAGGTWLGITRPGRWAFVTNVRDPSRHDPKATSRGALVPAALADSAPPAAALARLVMQGAAYNGFNLVIGSGSDAHWGTNRGGAVHALPAGVSGLSNAALECEWPKVTRTKAAVAAWCARGEDGFAALFAALSDRGCAPDQDLPSTGLSPERERLLSSPFIVSDDYGTRCSTVVAIGRDGNAQFVEVSFDPRGAATGRVNERFAIAARDASAVRSR